MSVGCDRFEREGLLRLERGESLEAHFGECTACLTAAAAYQRVRGALRKPLPQLPPPDWEPRVWAAIQRRAPSRTGWRIVPAIASLAAAAILIGVFSRGAAAPGLEWEVRKSAGELVRSGSASPGDVLRLQGIRGGHRYAELRLYRDGVLVLRCSDQPPCSTNEGRVMSEHTLSAVGRYESVLLLSDRPLASAPVAGSGPTRERDLDQALRERIQVVTIPAVDVY